MQAFPNNTAWRRLLIDVQERSKQYEALDAAIAQAVAAGDTDSSLLGRRASAQTELGESRLPTRRSRNCRVATRRRLRISRRRRSSRAPNTMNNRLLLISALMASGQSKAALAAANDAVKQDDTDALARMLRGFLLQQNGNRTEAAADFERALQSNVLTDTEILNYRLIAGNAALAAGSPIRRWRCSSRSKARKNADVADQRKLAEQMQANPRRARPALITPSTLCQSTNYGIICSVYYGGTGGGLGGPECRVTRTQPPASGPWASRTMLQPPRPRGGRWRPIPATPTTACCC